MRQIHKRILPLAQKHLFLFIPLILSAYTHLWNPVGFPDFFYDEGVYIRRALHLLDGLGPQELTSWYDHPYFGQIFLASVFKIIGYPDSLNPKAGEVHSIEMLYLVPRVLMGLLAVLDTFLVYKIGDKKYNRKVGFVAALLFAVMPGTWLLRRVLLDSILLPFLLASIFFAVSINERRPQSDLVKSLKGINLKTNLLTILSGVFLGLAIFVKIPVFAMIPLIAYLILTKSNYSNKRTRLKILGLWFMPVILIPTLWPMFAFTINHFDDWKDGVFRQAERNNEGLARMMGNYYRLLDPVMLIMGLLGLAYAVIRKELFTVIGIVPFLLFLYFIGYVSYYHIVPVLPVFCISAALLLVDAPVFISHKLRCPSLSKYTFGSITIIAVISGIGLISTSMLMVLDTSRAQIQAAVYTGKYLVANMTLISSPIYSWIPLYVFNHSQTLEFWDVPEGKVQYDYVILLADSKMQSIMKKDLVNLWSLYNSTTLTTQFKREITDYDTKKYPYTNLQAMREGASVDIRNGSHISIG